LYALPFEGFWHPWDEEEIRTPLGAHRFVTTLRIPSVDIYIALSDSLTDLCLGQFLRAPKRIAFAEGWKQWLTTIPVTRPVGQHLAEEYFAIYQALSNLRAPGQLRVQGRELPPYYPVNPDEPPYLAVDLWPFQPGNFDEFWADYFALFEGKRFVLFFGEEEAKGGLMVNHFVDRLPPRNRYDVFLSSDWIELGKMLTNARGLVCRAGATASYSTYLGTDALVIYENGDPKRDAPFYNYANWRLMDARPVPVTGVPSGLRPKSGVDPVELFRLTLDTFRF
jgi:ADP-heptose:LPS heptosyltransferase